MKKLDLTKGRVNSGNFIITIDNADEGAIIAGAGNSNYLLSWINGRLQRRIEQNKGSYDFPVGGQSAANILKVINNQLDGPSFLLASFIEKAGNDEGLQVSENGTPFFAVSPEGVWQLSHDAPIVRGDFSLHAYFDGFTGLTDNHFALLSRPINSSNASEWAVPRGSNIEKSSGEGRMVSHGYARRKDLSTFGEFGIGMTLQPLAVTLLNFSAFRQDKSLVKITWDTHTEVNNKGFEVERRFENEAHFFSNSFLPTKGIGGNSSGILHYVHIDNNSFQGVTYYRIKQLNVDGSFAYTAIKAVKGSPGIAVQVTIIPNPNNGQFRIFVSNTSKTYQALVTDSHGKTIKRLTVSGDQTFHIAGLAAGTYVLMIKDVFGKGKHFTEKLIVIR